MLHPRQFLTVIRAGWEPSARAPPPMVASHLNWITTGVIRCLKSPSAAARSNVNSKFPQRAYRPRLRWSPGSVRRHPGHLRRQRKILNIFPSIDTLTCAASVRQFNAQASTKPNTVIALHLGRPAVRAGPFLRAPKASLENVINLSTMRGREFLDAWWSPSPAARWSALPPDRRRPRRKRMRAAQQHGELVGEIRTGRTTPPLSFCNQRKTMASPPFEDYRARALNEELRRGPRAQLTTADLRIDTTPTPSR